MGRSLLNTDALEGRPRRAVPLGIGTLFACYQIESKGKEEKDYERYAPSVPKRVLKNLVFTLCSPFDKLKANGLGIEFVKDFPFVLSLSKHEDRLPRHALRITMLVGGLALLLPGQGYTQEEEVAAAGKPLFEDNCMVCHGNRGKGDGIMVTFG